MIGWLIGWLVDWLVDWLVGWFVGWLVDNLAVWLLDKFLKEWFLFELLGQLIRKGIVVCT